MILNVLMNSSWMWGLTVNIWFPLLACQVAVEYHSYAALIDPNDTLNNKCWSCFCMRFEQCHQMVLGHQQAQCWMKCYTWFPRNFSDYQCFHTAFMGCAVLLKMGNHDDIIKWKHFPRYWPFVQGIHWSPVNSPHKSQWHGALMFSLICAWIHSWVNNGEAGDLRRHRAHYDIVMETWYLTELRVLKRCANIPPFYIRHHIDVIIKRVFKGHNFEEW